MQKLGAAIGLVTWALPSGYGSSATIGVKRCYHTRRLGCDGEHWTRDCPLLAAGQAKSAGKDNPKGTTPKAKRVVTRGPSESE